MRRQFVLAATAALGMNAALGHPAPPAHADTGSPTATPSPSGTPSPSVTANPTATPSPAAIVATAQQYLGYPYAYIGDDPSTGFSCIGFVHFVFAQNGVYVPEDLSKAYASAPQVDQAHLQPGDLVFFQNTVWNGISHVDIYVGNGQMIGADTFQTGVQVDTLSDAYWQEHYLGATRPLSNPTGTPVNPSATPVPSGPSLAPPAGPSLSLKAGAAVTAQHDASVYSGPGTTYSAIDTVTSTEQLTIVQTQGQWVNVSYQSGNQYGWVRGSDLNLQGVTTSNSSGNGSSGSKAASGGNASQPNASGTPTASGAGATQAVQSTTTVYSGPSTGNVILASLTAGTEVSVLQSMKGWDQVTLPDGSVGWIDGRALSSTKGQRTSTSPATGQKPATPHVRVQVVKGFHATRSANTSAKGRQAVVKASVLFVRANPSTHARILRRVHAGDRLHILTARHGWDYVSLRDDSRGWVSAQWVNARTAA